MGGILYMQNLFELNMNSLLIESGACLEGSKANICIEIKIQKHNNDVNYDSWVIKDHRHTQ